MKRFVFVIAVVVIFLSFFESAALCQWVHMSGEPDSSGIRCMCVKGQYLFVANANGLYRTSDNGTNWQQVDSGLEFHFINCLLADDTILYAGVSQSVLRSTDDGISWTTVLQRAAGVSALIKHDTNLFAAADSVERSGNGGATWVTASINIGNGIGGFATAGTNIFACDYFGVFRSTNEGKMWYFANPAYQLHAIEASALVVTGTILIVSTNYIGGFYRTTNYGLTWITVDSGSSQAPVNSFVLSGTTIFACRSSNAAVSVSFDKGLHWVPRVEGLGDTNVHALAVSDKYIFAGTQNAGVWRRDLSEITSGVTQNESRPDFDLQIHPNPLVENANISFFLEEQSVVSIELFDLLGQNVKTIFRGFEDAGIHTLRFDTGTFPGGSYFICLTQHGRKTEKRLEIIR